MCQEIHSYDQCWGYQKPCKVKRFLDVSYTECYQSGIKSEGFGGCGHVDVLEKKVGHFRCDMCQRAEDLARACAVAQLAGRKNRTYYNELPGFGKEPEKDESQIDRSQIDKVYYQEVGESTFLKEEDLLKTPTERR